MDSSEKPYVFPARIQKIWIMRCIDVPQDVSRAVAKAFGGKPLHIPVHGWIEGLPFENTLVPRGGGNYRFHVHSKIWRKLRIDAGAAVEVTMLLDSEPREAVIPPDLGAALADTPGALATFNAQTVALRRQIVAWVEAAKQSRTRDKRVQILVQRMLERGRKKGPRKPAGRTKRRSPSKR
jgi:Bacteriocin-protection, YdeI or OmpD-Associated/Domain of unknown function (DUF1905)